MKDYQTRMAEFKIAGTRLDRYFGRPSLILSLVVGMTAIVGGVLLAFGGPTAALAVMVALGATLIVLRDIEIGFWGVVAVICLLPFATLPIDIGLTPTLLDLALAATVSVWTLRIVTNHRTDIAITSITVPLMIFILTALFSFIFGLGNGPLTAGLARHFAELLLSIGFVLVIVDFYSTWPRLERIVVVILLAGTGTAILGIVLWLLPDLTANDMLNVLQRIGYPGGLVIRYIEDNPELAERAIGTSVDPNALGGLLLMIGALASPQLAAKQPLLRRRIVFAMFGLLGVCLILTFSRGAMVGLTCSLLFVAAARYRRLVFYMALVALLILLLPVTQGYVFRFVEGFSGQDLATQMRFGEYRDAIALISRYPVFGVGFSGSPDIDLYLGVANVYLTIGQQMGLVGLSSFVVLLVAVFAYGYFNRANFRNDSRHDPLWLGLYAALVGGLVAGIFDHYLFNIDFHHAVTVFWLFLGLTVAATRVGGITAQTEPGLREALS